MRTATAPGGLAEGTEIDSKYRLGRCLTTSGARQVYETLYRGTPAAIDIFFCESSREAAGLADSFGRFSRFTHPNLLAVYDCGSSDTYAWVVTERWDECLADILLDRSLDEVELRQLTREVLPALQHLRESRLAPDRLNATVIFACGDRIRIGPARLVAASPEPDAAREDAEAVAAALVREASGAAEAVTVPEERVDFTAGIQVTPELKYRKFAGVAVGGALAAAVLCGLLIRGAHSSSDIHESNLQSFESQTIQSDQPASSAGKTVAHSVAKTNTAKTSTESYPEIGHGWAIVAAASNVPEDAVQRAAILRQAHSLADPRVYATGRRSERYIVVFASGLTAAQAKKQLARLKRAGAPRETYIARY